MTLKNKTLAIAAFIVISIFLATFLQILADYRQTYSQQKTVTSDIARLVDVHISKTTGEALNALNEVTYQIAEDGGIQEMHKPSRWNKLHNLCAQLEGCISIGIINSSGLLVLRSEDRVIRPIDVSDRAHFKVPAETRQLFVGPAVVSRIENNPVMFPISMPVYDSTGMLLAVASVAMDTKHITDFYGLMGFGVKPTVTIYKSNGDIVARYPDIKDYVGKNDAKNPLFALHLLKSSIGTYDAALMPSKEEGIITYRLLRDLDLVVSAGIEKNIALHAWKERSYRTAGIVGLLLVFILAALVYAHNSYTQQMQLEVKNRHLMQLSSLDGLTGIANRRQFDMTLKRDWERHCRERTPLSLLMIDIDHFKAYNDHYGHQKGDECLKEVAQALQTSILRKLDLVARYGGEEFAAILNDDHHGAALVAKRIQTAINALEVEHLHSKTSLVVTVSIGIASTVGNNFNTIEELLGAADKALYAAKEQGRNRFHLYTSKIPVPEPAV
jgi:diguanylate cyclase (GGDEF)-like protein